MMPPSRVAQQPLDIPGDGRWMSMHTRYKHELLHIESCDILLIGDSIVQQLQGTKFYEEILQRGKKNYNAGIGGDKIENILWRIEDGDWLQKLKPTVVVIFAGTNNVNSTPEERIELLDLLIKAVQERTPFSQVVIPHLLPRGEFDNKLRNMNHDTNELLKKKYSTEHHSNKIHLVDTGGTKIIDSNDGKISHKIMHDYLHLTNEGYQMTWKDVFDKCDDLINNIHENSTKND